MFTCVPARTGGEARFEFQVQRVSATGRGVVARPVTLVAVLDGGDNGRPVVTIMLKGES